MYFYVIISFIFNFTTVFPAVMFDQNPKLTMKASWIFFGKMCVYKCNVCMCLKMII